MASYTVEIDKRHKYCGIRVRPTGLIRGLLGACRNYPDLNDLSSDLAKYLSYTAAQIDEVLQSERLTREDENIELSDMDAAHFGWKVESTKRVYIFLKAEPVSPQADGNRYTIAAQTKLEESLTLPIPIDSAALLALLKRINQIPECQFMWDRHIQAREPFSVITVPHLWELACSQHGVDLAKWTVATLATPAPILVFADAIRSDMFTPDLQLKYPARYRHTCIQCSVDYELVVHLTDQGKFDTLPDPSLPPFEYLRQRINAGHPDHAETRLRSMGTNAFPVPSFRPSGQPQT